MYERIWRMSGSGLIAAAASLRVGELTEKHARHVAIMQVRILKSGHFKPETTPYLALGRLTRNPHDRFHSRFGPSTVREGQLSSTQIM
jgi:hypothetical protein